MTTIAELLQELEREAATTRRTLERVPDDRLDWRPHERSMTLGELAMHIAQLPGGIAGIAAVPAFDVGTAIPRPAPESTAGLLAALDESLARARSTLGAMDDASLEAPWSLVEGERALLSMPRALVLRSIMLNHWYHHRGQLTVYLRLVGAPVPPVYGATADENPFAAA